MSNKSAPIPKFGLGIDWETSGFSLPNYAEKHQGISFGAVIYDTSTYEIVEKLYCEIIYDKKYLWDDGAEKIHGLSRLHLSQNGMKQADAAILLANLIIKYIGTEDIQALGHRVHFDLAFTDQLMESIGVKLTWHPTRVDTCMLATALMEISRSDEVFEMLGLPARGQHNSLEDIEMTVASAKKMKEFFIAGVAASLG